MKLKVKFVSKTPKVAMTNEIVFVKNKNIKNNKLKPIIKTIFNNQLFKEQFFMQKEYGSRNHIFVNCSKTLSSTDYESIGSKLFAYLKNNKLENSFIDASKANINNIQLEKTIHGAKLKSYNFDIYKSDNKKNKIINLNIVGMQATKSNTLRKKLEALLEGVFFTRDLVSEPGNVLHPDEYAKRLIKLKKIGIKVTVYDNKKLKKLGTLYLVLAKEV